MAFVKSMPVKDQPHTELQHVVAAVESQRVRAGYRLLGLQYFKQLHAMAHISAAEARHYLLEFLKGFAESFSSGFSHFYEGCFGHT